MRRLKQFITRVKPGINNKIILNIGKKHVAQIFYPRKSLSGAYKEYYFGYHYGNYPHCVVISNDHVCINLLQIKENRFITRLAKGRITIGKDYTLGNNRACLAIDIDVKRNIVFHDRKTHGVSLVLKKIKLGAYHELLDALMTRASRLKI